MVAAHQAAEQLRLANVVWSAHLQSGQLHAGQSDKARMEAEGPNQCGRDIRKPALAQVPA